MLLMHIFTFSPLPSSRRRDSRKQHWCIHLLFHLCQVQEGGTRESSKGGPYLLHWISIFNWQTVLEPSFHQYQATWGGPCPIRDPWQCVPLWDAKWSQVSSEAWHDENGARGQLQSESTAWLAQHANDHSGDAGTAAELPSMENCITACYTVEDEDLCTAAAASSGSDRQLSYQFAAVTRAGQGPGPPGFLFPVPQRPQDRVGVPWAWSQVELSWFCANVCRFQCLIISCQT